MIFSLYVLRYAKLRYQATLNSEKIKPACSRGSVAGSCKAEYCVQNTHMVGSGGMPLQISSEITY